MNDPDQLQHGVLAVGQKVKQGTLSILSYVQWKNCFILHIPLWQHIYCI